MKNYDELIEAIQKRNSDLIENFADWLKRSGLSEKTISKHTDNIEFFLNEYVVYKETSDSKGDITLCNAEDGIDLVDDFLGYWFIKKLHGQARVA